MDLIQGLILGATIFDYWFDKAIIIYGLIIITKLFNVAATAIKAIGDERYE